MRVIRHFIADIKQKIAGGTRRDMQGHAAVLWEEDEVLSTSPSSTSGHVAQRIVTMSATDSASRKIPSPPGALSPNISLASALSFQSGSVVVLFTGWLLKKGARLFRSWRKRFFQLNNNGKLEYFKYVQASLRFSSGAERLLGHCCCRFHRHD